MLSAKSHYSLNEAADLLNCKVRDLIHLAVQEKVTLLAGVPDNVRFRTFDASADLIEPPALLEPQLLVLRQSHCLQIELNGKTEQCDFQEGYLINPAGQLQKLMPSYGRPKLNHLWAYWRTYDGPFSKKIELLPERLFVVGTDLLRLINPTPKVEKARTTAKKQIEATFTSAQSSLEPPVNLDNETVENVIPNIIKPVSQISEAKSTTQSQPASISEPTLKIIRLKIVQERTGLSRSTIYDKINPRSPRHDPTFPKQVNLGIGSVGWYESELIHWIESRKLLGTV